MFNDGPRIYKMYLHDLQKFKYWSTRQLHGYARHSMRAYVKQIMILAIIDVLK